MQYQQQLQQQQELPKLDWQTAICRSANAAENVEKEIVLRRHSPRYANRNFYCKPNALPTDAQRLLLLATPTPLIEAIDPGETIPGPHTYHHGAICFLLLLLQRNIQRAAAVVTAEQKDRVLSCRSAPRRRQHVRYVSVSSFLSLVHSSPPFLSLLVCSPSFLSVSVSSGPLHNEKRCFAPLLLSLRGPPICPSNPLGYSSSKTANRFPMHFF